jgi:predicted nucleotidyltransferase
VSSHGTGEQMSGNNGLSDRDDLFAEVIESFYLETKEDLFFAVKGFEHPPDRRIAVLRYMPDTTGGDRNKGGKFYRRLYHFDEQEQQIRSAYPQYIAYDPVFQTTLQSVPESMVRKIYDPRQRFRELALASTRAEIEEDAVAFLGLLQTQAQVSSSALGITGSLLTGLFTEKSDLDVVVFGTENCRSVYRALLRMLDERSCPDLYRLNAAGMRELFEQRVADTYMAYEEFVKLEKGKANQGRFRQRAYFVRFVRNADEAEYAYGSMRYSPIGRAVITASIADDRDAIFTPCRYPLANVRLLEGPQRSIPNEIISFRGRFCEQVRAGELVYAAGTLERIEHDQGGFHYRLLLGNFPEDTLISSSLKALDL